LSSAVPVSVSLCKGLSPLSNESDNP